MLCNYRRLIIYPLAFGKGPLSSKGAIEICYLLTTSPGVSWAKGCGSDNIAIPIQPPTEASRKRATGEVPWQGEGGGRVFSSIVIEPCKKPAGSMPSRQKAVFDG